MAADMSDLLQAFRLYEKTSKNGNIYYVGRLGGLKVLMLRSDREKGSNGEAVWNVMFGEAAPYKGESPAYKPSTPKRSPDAPPERERDADDPALSF